MWKFIGTGLTCFGAGMMIGDATNARRHIYYGAWVAINRMKSALMELPIAPDAMDKVRTYCAVTDTDDQAYDISHRYRRWFDV